MKNLSVCKLLVFSVIACVQVCSAWSSVESYIIDGTGFYDSDCTILSSDVTGKSHCYKYTKLFANLHAVLCLVINCPKKKMF